jgi:CheY-like chemotaxis protein
MSSTTLRILLLDDNPHDRQLTLRELRKEFPGVHVIEPLDDAQSRQALQMEEFELVITDYNLQWSNGVEIVRSEVHPPPVPRDHVHCDKHAGDRRQRDEGRPG